MTNNLSSPTPTIIITPEVIEARLAERAAYRYWKAAVDRHTAVCAARWDKGKTKINAFRDFPSTLSHERAMQEEWEKAAKRLFDLERLATFWD